MTKFSFSAVDSLFSDRHLGATRYVSMQIVTDKKESNNV